MSKKYKHKTCAYCATENSSDTADHVLARELVAISHRQEIPIVPACKTCNQKKSVLEHYAATVLPFGGRHPDSSNRLNEDVPKRLRANLRLHREISSGTTRVWVRNNGIFSRTLAIPFDGTRIEKLVDYIARGLMFHHWGVALDGNCAIEVLTLTFAGEAFFNQMKQWESSQLVFGNIGNGALIYEGRQGTDNQSISVWELSLLGGAQMAQGNHFTSTKFGVMTGPRAVFDRAAVRASSSLIIRP
ncbi:MAG: hypothetical protein KGO53_03700 [Alphaproteobacteria bacterium]|nr:hypothetical protein [Alphaproteobacteria bacterium]